MRIWIYGALLCCLMVSNVAAQDSINKLQTYEGEQNLFAMTPDCKILVKKDTNAADFSTYVQENAKVANGECEKAELLHFIEDETKSSNLLVFLPFSDSSEKPYKKMKFYGQKLAKTDNIAFKFETMDLSYALPAKCGFDPDNFKVGIDVNVIFMLVTCENHLAFLRAQVNFEYSTIFVPRVPLVHFDKFPATKLLEASPCAANKIAFVPYSGELDRAGDSYVVRYCDALTEDKKFYSYSSQLHNINAVPDREFDVELEVDKIPASGAVQNLLFLTSQVYVMKFGSNQFYTGTVDDRSIDEPKNFMEIQKFDENNQQFFEFDASSTIVMMGREYVRSGLKVVTDADGQWKIQKDDPELKPDMDVSVECDLEKEKRLLKECEEACDSIKLIHIIMYCLIGLEFALMLATVGVFAFCVVTQRKRRRLHREKKAMRRKHGKHGKKHGNKKKNKTDKDDGGAAAAGGAGETSKSSEKEAGKSDEKKASKKESVDNNETSKKTTDFYTIPTQFQDKSKDKE